MSRLSPEFITLNQGLDLQSPKIAAPPGTLLDSLNYEQVDFQGQKRIDGFVRYDGSLGSDQDDLYAVNLGGESSAEVGALVYVVDEVAGGDGDLVGVVTSFDNGVAVLAILNQNLIPTVGQELNIGTVYEVAPLAEQLSPEEQYDAILQSNAVLRERATSLPGPVAGLHWFNDRLYSVASVVKTPNTEDYEVNDMHVRGPVLKVQDGHIYIGTTERDPADVYSDVASLYQSRTEQQARDELGDALAYGWEFIHQGWEVPFFEGISLYGDLVALNQNRTGIGVEGPTSTSGSNGSPLTLLQNVEITNTRSQVSGWKNYDNPSAYNLNPAYVQRSDDPTYVYADAYISWDDAGTITVESENLTQYSSTNSVAITDIV